MNLYHISKILEIAGFLLATIFGSILLNREVAGRFADRITIGFKKFSHKLSVNYTSLAKPAIFLADFDDWAKAKAPMLQGLLGAIVIRGISVVCVVIGHVIDVSWLFWVGIILAIPYVIIGAAVVLLRLLSRVGVKGIWFYPILLSWSLILSFVLAPIALFVYSLILLAYGIITLFFYVITKDATLNKGLLIFGSILILTGLVIELIVTW